MFCGRSGVHRLANYLVLWRGCWRGCWCGSLPDYSPEHFRPPRGDWATCCGFGVKARAGKKKSVRHGGRGFFSTHSRFPARIPPQSPVTFPNYRALLSGLISEMQHRLAWIENLSSYRRARTGQVDMFKRIKNASISRASALPVRYAAQYKRIGKVRNGNGALRQSCASRGRLVRHRTAPVWLGSDTTPERAISPFAHANLVTIPQRCGS